MTMNIGQASFNAIVIERQSLMIQTKDLQNRRVKIVDGGNLVDGLVTEVVRPAVTEPLLHSGASHPSGKATRIVVATTGPLLKCWHPTELRTPHDQCVL